MKVVITGMSMLTAAGRTLAEGWSGIAQGQSGLGGFDSIPTVGVSTRWGGQVRSVEEPGLEDDDRAIQLAALALGDALRDAGLKEANPYPQDRRGLSVGTCIGGARRGEAFQRQWISDGLDAADNRLLWQYPLHALGDALASEFALLGARTVNSNACAAGAVAIANGMEVLRSGHADVMVVGGSDPLAYLPFAGFSSLSALSAEHCAPYTRSDGLTLGEGAAFLILEEDNAARNRGAQILAELRGYGLSADAYHPTAPDPRGRGARSAMVAAARMAGIEMTEIDYINGHGTGTPANDTGELRLISSLGSPHPPVSSTKSMIGHTLGAAGAVESVVSIKALVEQVLPPTHVPEDSLAQQCKTARLEGEGIDIVPDRARQGTIGVVASNSFAFGGNNASLLFSPPDSDDSGPEYLDFTLEVTGVGAIAGHAVDTLQVADKLFDGTRLYDEVATVREGASYPVGMVPDKRLKSGINPRSLRRLDRLSRLAAQAVSELLVRTRLSSEALESSGLVFATGYGPLTAIEEFQRGLLVSGEGDSRIFPNTVMNAAAGHVALLKQMRGPTATFCAGGTSAVSALHFAGQLMRSGACERVILVAADEVTRVLLSGFHGQPGFLSTGTLNPRGNTGRLFCEAAVGVLLERPDSHPDRATLAEIVGFGMAGDGSVPGTLRRDCDGILRAMTGALDDAGIGPGSVDVVVSAACGRDLPDRLEQDALERLGLASGASVSFPKGVQGDTLSAAPMLGVLQAVWMRQRGRVPALLSGAAGGLDISGSILTLINSFEIGGSYQSIMVRT